MKALLKKDLIKMIDVLYSNDNDLIFTEDLVNHMRSFGDDYQYNKEDGDIELKKENNFRF